MRKRRKLYFISVFFIVFLILHIFCNVKIDNVFVSKSKCPSCYGNDLCNDLQEAEVFKNWNILSVLNTKNVYLGKFKDKKCVMKKLAHNNELDNFDSLLCSSYKLSGKCDVSDVMKKMVIEENGSITNILTKYSKLFSNTGVLQCNDKNLIKYLFRKYSTNYNNTNNNFLENVAHFMTLLAVNPEPIFSVVSLI